MAKLAQIPKKPNKPRRVIQITPEQLERINDAKARKKEEEHNDTWAWLALKLGPRAADGIMEKPPEEALELIEALHRVDDRERALRILDMADSIAAVMSKKGGSAVKQKIKELMH